MPLRALNFIKYTPFDKEEVSIIVTSLVVETLLTKAPIVLNTSILVTFSV